MSLLLGLKINICERTCYVFLSIVASLRLVKVQFIIKNLHIRKRQAATNQLMLTLISSAHHSTKAFPRSSSD